MDIVLRESERLNDTIRSLPGLRAAAAVRDRAVRRAPRPARRRAAAAQQRETCSDGHVIEVDVPAERAVVRGRRGADQADRLEPGDQRAARDARRRPAAAVGRRGADRARGVPDGHVVIGVEDEGVGIPPEELDGSSSRSTAAFAKGSGLGLAIVHRIVTDYNGEIQVSSTAGRRHHGRRCRLPARAVATSMSDGDDRRPTPAADRRAPAAHPRRRRRAVDARAAGDRAAARGLRGAAGRERPSGDRDARARAGRSADLRHQDARHERRRGAARRQADRPGHPRRSWSPRSRRPRRPSRRCGSARATT